MKPNWELEKKTTRARKKLPKPKIEKWEMKAYNDLHRKLVSADETTNLVLYHKWKPYSFAVITFEIRGKTKLGRELLDKIKRMRLIR